MPWIRMGPSVCKRHDPVNVENGGSSNSRPFQSVSVVGLSMLSLITTDSLLAVQLSHDLSSLCLHCLHKDLAIAWHRFDCAFSHLKLSGGRYRYLAVFFGEATAV